MINDDVVNAVKAALVPLTLSDPRTRIETLNAVAEEVALYSLFKDPVGVVRWVPLSLVKGNDYNPNKVAPPEMRLLEVSITEDGYTQPIVAFKDPDGKGYTVVDGFHRYRVARENKSINARLRGHVPLVVIDKPPEERMASTIRHNRARGKHGVAPMSEIVATLAQAGWEDARIGVALGMDPDEVLRLKQQTGLPDLFKDREFSEAWEELFQGPANEY